MSRANIHVVTIRAICICICECSCLPLKPRTIMSNSKNVLAAFFNHHAMRPFFFQTQTSQTLCRRSVLALGDASPSPRQCLLYTSRPLCATITTSTSSSSSSSSMPSTSSTLSSSSASSSSSGYPPPLNSSFDDRMRRPSVQVAQVVRAPTQDDINKMELDAEVVPRSELRLLVTDRAAEVRTERVK